MKKEYWKPVLGYEGLYMVSNCGRIKSLDTYRKGKNGTVKFYKGRILKPVIVGRGYLQVGLYKNGKVKKFTVHRLVAEAFISNPDNLPCVNHKDENPQNNNVENLEFCTYEYNNTYGTRIEKSSKKLFKTVVQYDLEGNFIKEWKSAIQAEREGGFNHGNIATCCKGKRKSHHKFIWRYK